MIGYGMPYMNMSGTYMNELQNMRDRIDTQIQQVQQQQQSMPQLPIQQPTNLTQNFQLANTSNNNFKLVNNIDDVNKEIVLTDTYFLANGLNNLWIKKSNGDVRTFTLEEVVEKDEKDLLIERLQAEINKLKGGNINEHDESTSKLLYEQSNANTNIETGEQLETVKPSNVSTISNSKAAKRKS